MQTRKIKVKLENGDLIKSILRKLDLGCAKIVLPIQQQNPDNSEIMIEIEVPDRPESYKNLSTFDWDFMGESNEEVPHENLCMNHEISLKTSNNLTTYIEAAWRLAKTSNLMFPQESDLYSLYVEVGSEKVSLEHAMLKMIIENYYRDVNWEEAVEDTKRKIEKYWSEFKGHPSIASIAKLLYNDK